MLSKTTLINKDRRGFRKADVGRCTGLNTGGYRRIGEGRESGANHRGRFRKLRRIVDFRASSGVAPRLTTRLTLDI